MDRGTNGHRAPEPDDLVSIVMGRFRKAPSGCWEWTARRSAQGYAVVSLHGREVTIHRVACFFKNGPPPRGKGCACHTCDNRGCINPDHLYWGSRRDNAIDFVKRDGKSLDRLRDLGRRQRGENHPRARLTQDQVDEIRAMLPSFNNKQIAKAFGVSSCTIRLIRIGKTWVQE